MTEITYLDQYRLKTFTFDPTTKPVKYGASTEENPNYTVNELQILETAEIIKYSYIHRKYKNDLNSSIYKQQMNVSKQRIHSFRQKRRATPI